MRHVLLLGATGLVGQALLRELLADEAIQQVSVLTRKPLPLAHIPTGDKLHQAPLQHGKSLAQDLAMLAPLDAAFCCLGTTQKKAGSKTAFRAVDYELPLTIGRLLKKQGLPHYQVISSMGANPRSLSYYSRIKGELERDLEQLQLPRLSLIRPSLLLGKREEKRLAEDFAQRVSPYLNAMLPRRYQAIPATTVAQAMHALCYQPGPAVELVPSDQLQTLAAKAPTKPAVL